MSDQPAQAFVALVYEAFGSYRLAIVTLITFFIAGGLLLRRVRVAQGTEAVDNRPPAVI